MIELKIFSIILIGIVLLMSVVLSIKENNKKKSLPVKIKDEKETEENKIIDYSGYIKGYEDKSGRKGELEEYKIFLQLSKLPEEYKIINDVMIPNNKGFAQIDHIIVSLYGIFVLETKNYAGLITGMENDFRWQQEYKNRKNTFYNPLKQNNTHITALKKILKDYPKIIYRNLVIFSLRCDLRVLSRHVIQDINLENYILKNSSNRVLENFEVDEIFNLISQVNITDEISRKRHINYVKKMKELNV